MVLLEAAAGGLPIVATKAGGNQEVVLDGRTGFVVPPRDHQALASALLQLMELSEGERRMMGERGREHVRTNYGLARLVTRWERLYHDILARKAFLPRAAIPSGDEVSK
jgi:glycosyltransferase involved in cell wall biosynthesis